MQRTFAFALVAAVTTFAAVSLVSAEENAPPRGPLYFSPGNGSGTMYRYRKWANRATPAPQTTVSDVSLARNGQRVVARPVTYGVRFSLGSMYPAAIFGQTAPPSPQPGAGYPAASGAAPGYPTSINPEKYSYASRGNGSCYDGMAYSPVYNSGYYTSGCYESNACCRTSRRRCTLFGGMFRGCGSCCYSPPPTGVPDNLLRRSMLCTDGRRHLLCPAGVWNTHAGPVDDTHAPGSIESWAKRGPSPADREEGDS